MEELTKKERKKMNVIKADVKEHGSWVAGGSSHDGKIQKTCKNLLTDSSPM